MFDRIWGNRVIPSITTGIISRYSDEIPKVTSQGRLMYANNYIGAYTVH
jgi:hypothetical protein